MVRRLAEAAQELGEDGAGVARAQMIGASDIEKMVAPTESVTRVLPMVRERVAARLVPVSPSDTGKR